MSRSLAASSSAETTVRERLLAAALELFTSRGYAATSVREICAAAGVTKPVLYYHFRNKEGIYRQLLQDGFAEFEGLVNAALNRPGTARERLHTLLATAYDVFLDRVAECRLMYAIYYGPPQGAPPFDFDMVHNRFRETVRIVVQDGMAAGEFTPGNVDEKVLTVIAVLNMAMEMHLCHPGQTVGRAGLARMLDMVFDGLSARAAVVKRSSR